MENATKALMIAAGVLIGLLILSLGINLYMSLGAYVSDARAEIAENEIRKFNEQFFKYEGKTNLTIQDVITARNAALEINKSYSDYDITKKADNNSNYVDVYFNNVSTTETIFDETINKTEKLLNDYMNKKIKCTISVSTVTGKVFKLEFECID